MQKWRKRKHAKVTPMHIRVNSFSAECSSTARATQLAIRRLSTGDYAKNNPGL
jgi:hypothetical protein